MGKVARWAGASLGGGVHGSEILADGEVPVVVPEAVAGAPVAVEAAAEPAPAEPSPEPEPRPAPVKASPSLSKAKDS